MEGKKLPDSPAELSLVEDDELAWRRGNQRLAAGAYDPYNVDARASQPKAARSTATTRTDLRKLSQWIKLRREVDEAKAADDDTVEIPRPR